jgi:hypothetical protein
MTPAEFEAYLPELFEAGGGKISEDPRFTNFFKANPNCAALVFEPTEEPADSVWSNIASKLKEGGGEEEKES